MNNFVIFIEFALNELVYDFHVRDILKLLTDLPTETSNFDRLRFIKREKVDDVIVFVNVMIKNRYDSIYIIMKFEI